MKEYRYRLLMWLETAEKWVVLFQVDTLEEITRELELYRTSKTAAKVRVQRQEVMPWEEVGL